MQAACATSSLPPLTTAGPKAHPQPSAAVLEGILQQADHHFQQGNPAVARDFLQLAATCAPENVSVLTALGALQCQLGELEQAENALQQAANLQPNDASLKTQLAAVQLQRNRIDEFRWSIEDALALDPAHLEALRLLERHHREAKNWEDAARLNYRILKQQPDDLTALLAIGKCFYRVGDNEAALLSFDRVLELDPDNEVAREAVEIIGPMPAPTTATTASPAPTISREAETHLEAADNAYLKGDLKEARRSLKRALELEPRCFEVLSALGALEFQLFNYGNAFDHFFQATELRPEQVTAQVQLANTALCIDRIDAFESALGRALQLEPDHLDALRLLANTNLREGRYEDAARIFYRILGQKRDDIPTLLGLAKCFMQLGDRASAQASYEEVLRLDPLNALALEAQAKFAVNGHAKA